MPRLPRLQYPGAIYHLVTRGDGRRTLFHDDGHYVRFTQGLSDEVDRSGWVVLAFCWMPNHVHALIKTPEPNLCRGMQHWLSGYAYSSYGGYARQSRRLDWVAYDEHHRYWSGGNGGKDPTSAYRRFVKAGMLDSIDSRVARLRDWVYGGEDFLKRVLSMAEGFTTQLILCLILPIYLTLGIAKR